MSEETWAEGWESRVRETKVSWKHHSVSSQCQLITGRNPDKLRQLQVLSINSNAVKQETRRLHRKP